MKRARSTEHRSWPKHHAEDHAGDVDLGRRRAANAVDGYSLALQLIQVFPIVSQAAILMVATTWLARALSGSCLLLGTAWVVYLERNLKRQSVDPEDAHGIGDHGLMPGTSAVAAEASADVATELELPAVLQTRTLPVVVETSIAHGDRFPQSELTRYDGRIHVAVSLHLSTPEPPSARPCRNAAAHRRVRHRPSGSGSKSLERKEGGGADSTDGASTPPVTSSVQSQPTDPSRRENRPHIRTDRTEHPRTIGRQPSALEYDPRRPLLFSVHGDVTR